MKSDCGQEKKPLAAFRCSHLLAHPLILNTWHLELASQEMTIIFLELTDRGLLVLASQDMYTKIWNMK